LLLLLLLLLLLSTLLLLPLQLPLLDPTTLQYY
jgi:hypothetical protein